MALFCVCVCVCVCLMGGVSGACLCQFSRQNGQRESELAIAAYDESVLAARQRHLEAKRAAHQRWQVTRTYTRTRTRIRAERADTILCACVLVCFVVCGFCDYVVFSVPLCAK